MKVTDNIEIVPNVTANCYLIIEPNNLTLIDTGLPRSGKKILNYIDDIGLSSVDLKSIVITHADIDHIGGLDYIKSRGSAEVYCSNNEADAIETGRQSRELKLRGLIKFFFGIVNQLIKIKPVKIDHRLGDGDVLPVLGGLKVVESPGHTPGHISLYLPSLEVLFTGDSLISNPSGKLMVSSGMNTWDESEAWRSAEKQAKLEPSIVCPGHGPIVKNAQGKFPVKI